MCIEVKDLITGEVYSAITANGTRDKGLWMMRSDGGHRFKVRLNSTDISFNNSFGNGGNIHKTLRIPTEEELQWFLECEKLKKWIDFDTFQETQEYQIY